MIKKSNMHAIFGLESNVGSLQLIAFGQHVEDDVGFYTPLAYGRFTEFLS